MGISVKLVGALKHAARSEKLTMEYRERITVKKLIEDILVHIPELRQNLIDPQLSTLILVNKAETSALNGLETLLKDEDEVVLIPVVHGG